MFLIDTNIHASLLLKEYEKDKLTKVYLQFYDQIPVNQRLIPDFILNELETFMLQVVFPRFKLTPDKKKDMKQAFLAYFESMFQNYPIITPSEHVIRKAFILYHDTFSTRYISFADSLLLALAQTHHFTLFTKDQKINIIARDMKIPFFTPET